MNLQNNNHLNRNEFGISPWQFIYIGPNRPDVLTTTQDVTIKRPPIEETERKMKAHEDLTKKKTAEYNTQYAISGGSGKPFEKTVLENFDHPEATIAEIDAILDTPYELDGRMRKLRTYRPSRERRNQKHDLLRLRQLFVDYIAMKNVERGKRSYFLTRKSDRVTEMMDQKKGVERRKEYQDLSDDYDQVFGILGGRDKDFRRFYEKPDGTIDPNKARENKQLFFSILHHETNGFKTDFILGKFTNNPDENKKNYPFIYHEWAKTKFDVKKKEAAQTEVAERTKNLGLTSPNEGLRKVSDIKTALNTTAASLGQPNFPNSLSSIPASGPRSPGDYGYYTKVEKAFKAFRTDITLRIDNIDDNPALAQFVESLKKIKKNKLPKYIELAEKQYDLAKYTADAKRVDNEFTKIELRKPKNRQLVLELAMLKFAKVMKNVDSPFTLKEANFGDNLHPRVRRMLIATMYYEGVGRYDPGGTDKYKDDVSKEYTWALSKLIQSKYFNPTLKNKFLNPEQREFLFLARYANLALSNINYLKKDVIGKLETVIPRLQRNLPAPPSSPNMPQINADIAEIQRHTGSRITQANAISIAQGIISTKKSEITLMEAFYKEAEAIMANPDRNKMRAFIEKTKSSPVLGSANNKKKIEDFAKYLQSVDLNYNMFEFKEKSTGNYLERMGLNPEGIYKAYLVYWKKHPDMKVDQWDHHLRDAKGTQKLLDMFKGILPPSTTFKGREEFLRIFATLNGLNPLATKPGVKDSQAVTINIFNALKLEVKHRDDKEAASRAGNEAALEKLDGMTFGDRVTEYAKGVKDMLLGPGQSIANRAAGFAILFALYKVANHAIRGEKGGSRTFLRLLLMAGATELALKHLTGEGLTDKLKLDGLADSLSGTYEDVLLDRAKDKFGRAEYAGESITETDHSKALVELRRSNVPFAKIVAWYKSTKPDGSPNASRETVRLPVDYSAIVSGTVDKNSEGRGRFILKKTIENFFEYVANKDEQAGNKASTGMNILEEVWVKPVKDKSFNVNKAKYTDRALPSTLLEELQRNPRSVTWQMVMQSEIRPEDVEEVKKRKATQQAKDFVISGYTSLAKWSRRDIEQKVGAHAKEFWKNVDTRHAPAIKDFLVRMGEIGGAKLSYGARHVELWYKDKKYEIRKFGREHWELIVQSVKFPFQVIYAADQWLLPRLSKWIRQTQEIVRMDKMTTIPKSRDLQIDDVMSDDLFNKFQIGSPAVPGAPGRPAIPASGPKPTYAIFDRKVNPQAEYFGIYTVPFRKALQEKLKGGGRIAFYESETRFSGGLPHMNALEGNPNVGYYISEVNETNTPGIKPTDSLQQRMWAMNVASREQAKKVYLAKGVPAGDIDRYMRPIHVITRSGGEIKDSAGRVLRKEPKKVYIFWRMPLKGSEELDLIKQGKLPDFIDPNRRKMTLPFKVDPRKSMIQNLTAAYGIQSPFLRKGGRAVSIAIGQWLHVVLGMAEKSGDLVQWLGSNKHIAKALGLDPTSLHLIEDLSRLGTDEKSLQWIDEYLGTASFAPLSDFYKVKAHSDIYNQAVEISMRSGNRINLEVNEETRTLWGWTPMLIDTGKKDIKGKTIYLGGVDPKTKKPIKWGRLNTDLYRNPAP